MYIFLLTFKDLEVLECLQRPFDVKQYYMDIPNLGFPLEEEESAVKKRCLETKATTGVHVTEGEHDSVAHVTEGEQEEAAAHVTEGEHDSVAHVTEGEQEEAAAHVTEGEHDSGVHVTEGEQDSVVHVTEGEHDSVVHVTEGEHDSVVHVTEGEQEEAAAHVTEGEQEEAAALVTDEVKTAESRVAKVQRTSAYKRRKLVRPTLSSCAMYTAQPRKNIPGHTGYLTFATLHTKQQRSGATSDLASEC